MALQTREKQACYVGSSSGQKQLSELRTSDFPSRRLIGKGQCGIVYETTWNGKKYARKDFMDVPREIFRDEASVLLGLQEHKNIVKTHGLTIDNRSCSLVLEYMDDDLVSLLRKRKEWKRIEADKVAGNSSQASSVIHSSLHEFIDERRKNPVVPGTGPPPLELPEALHVMLEIARGMAHLHEQKVAHGDLKPRNVLVTYSNEGVKSVKVADFGLLQTKSHSTYFVSHHGHKLDMARWKAPEYLDMMFGHKLLHTEDLELHSDEDEDEDEDEDKASRLSDYDWLCRADVYSFGVTCFQVLIGEVPYPKVNWKEVMSEILSQGLRPTLPATFQCTLLSGLLESCWDANFAQRPTFSAICMKLEELIHQLEKTGAVQLKDNSTPGLTEVGMIFDIEQGVLPNQGQGRIEKTTQLEESGSRRRSEGSAQGPMEIGMPRLSNFSANNEAISKTDDHSAGVKAVGDNWQNPPMIPTLKNQYATTPLDPRASLSGHLGLTESNIERTQRNLLDIRRPMLCSYYDDLLRTIYPWVKRNTDKKDIRKVKVLSHKVDNKNERIEDLKTQVYNLLGSFSMFQGVVLTAAHLRFRAPMMTTKSAKWCGYRSLKTTKIQGRQWREHKLFEI